MKPVKQIAAARLMIASNMYSQRFAQALLAGTSDEMLGDQKPSVKSRFSGCNNLPNNSLWLVLDL
jgi:hypothetical protein